MLSKAQNGKAISRELEEALGPDGKGQGLESSVRINALIKRGAEVGGLRGEDPELDGDWCTPQMFALYRRLLEVREDEKRARRDAERNSKMAALLVRREPLAVLRARLSGGAASGDVAVSFWCFGPGGPPVGGKKDSKDACAQKLWAMVSFFFFAARSLSRLRYVVNGGVVG